ncbi:Aminotran_3 domain-containing protein [Cephalotus follicularis]|uniref:Aminotran_3 domain-containing protein n=1 Tax=Cephalotus follicularis TaxID=3775 RepID=A0A1Q3DGU9_CEPFO|nr:Aminotran_3 domain-containing protein [Cephalotus follicularis]
MATPSMIPGIGNDIPLGAVITTPEIAEVLTRRCYFKTFGGNPVCTAAGLTVLKIIEKEKLQENAFVVGSYLKERLPSFKDKYDSKLSSLPFCVCAFILFFNKSFIHKYKLLGKA